VTGAPRTATQWSGLRPLLLGATLAAIAGWVDTVGFVGLHGLFIAHVTGNFVLLGAGLVAGGGGFVAKLLVLPVFVAGVACAGCLHAFPGRRPAAAGLLLELAGLSCFLAAAVLAAPIDAGGANYGLPLLAACAGAFAMGVQSAQSRLSLMGATTAMTGNVTQLVLEAMGALGLVPAQRDHARKRMLKILAPVAGFAAGCFSGGLAYLAWSFWALLAPMAVLCALVCLAPE
jgi:uncharacterized membrane protein YoaK (UPF0700 family)